MRSVAWEKGRSVSPPSTLRRYAARSATAAATETSEPPANSTAVDPLGHTGAVTEIVRPHRNSTVRRMNTTEPAVYHHVAETPRASHAAAGEVEGSVEALTPDTVRP
jgi:hypothetical protein